RFSLSEEQKADNGLFATLSKSEVGILCAKTMKRRLVHMIYKLFMLQEYTPNFKLRCGDRTWPITHLKRY
ncbi:MAG: hypothetical protein P1S59_14235, partial [bacterium]|nr:hypothetical protein [bacterium]